MSARWLPMPPPLHRRPPLPPTATPSPPTVTFLHCRPLFRLRLRRLHDAHVSSKPFYFHFVLILYFFYFRSSTLPDSPPPPLAADSAALRTIISLLSGYTARFLKHPTFRLRLRHACSTCLAPSTTSPNALLSNLQLAINTTHTLAEEPNNSKLKSLHNSIRLLSLVTNLNSPHPRTGFTSGIPNSHLAACSQLYLSIMYKMEHNDHASAQHLLQCFADAPNLARRKLAPDLWDHFLLPHLLHLKVWYGDQIECIASWDAEGLELKSLNRAYSDQMDAGTAELANYYKEWLQAGGNARPLPTIPLPARPGCVEPLPGKRSVSLSNINLQSDIWASQRRSSLARECRIPDAISVLRESHPFRVLSCHGDPSRGAICRTQISQNSLAGILRQSSHEISSRNFGRAIFLISNSNNLSEREDAVHVVAKVWLDLNGATRVKAALSTSSVIEGLLAVALTSKDDEVLELAISILAVLVAKNEMNRQLVHNADPHLEIFLRLLRSKTLFLKAAVLLYLLKPKAKQMLSWNWIPLVLSVLDYGDQMQTLFTVKCNPKSAAFYFLDQLLMGFDVDRNVENVKHTIACGGLDLLTRRLEMGDARERRTCASLLVTCIHADGSSRYYLAANLKKDAINQMLLGSQLKLKGIVLLLLCELVCLNRITQIIQFLNGLKNAGYMNTMHALLVYFQEAPIKQRPLVGSLLLQLVFLRDPLQYSVYRDEGIDAIVAALENSLQCKKLQEQCSRTLLRMGSRFSCTGESIAEEWLLKKAGLDDGPADLFKSKVIISDDIQRLEEEERTTEDWLRRLAVILLTSGNKRFLVALSNCIAEGIPSLARSSLVTVAWISHSLSSMHNARALSSLACSILAPRLLMSLNCNRTLEERALASLSMLNFVRHPECLPKLYPLDKETIHSLQDLTEVTWTAKELLSACCR